MNSWTIGWQHGPAPTASATLVNDHPGWDMNGRCLYVDNVQLNTEATIFIVSVARSGMPSWGSMVVHGSRDQDKVI